MKTLVIKAGRRSPSPKEGMAPPAWRRGGGGGVRRGDLGSGRSAGVLRRDGFVPAARGQQQGQADRETDRKSGRHGTLPRNREYSTNPV